MDNSKSFETVFNDVGNFSYEQDGFSRHFGTAREDFKWKDLAIALGFKRDLLTTDCVCLQLFFKNNFCFELNEEMRGWYAFQRQMEIHFPQTKDWELRVIWPAFETALTLVYD